MPVAPTPSEIFDRAVEEGERRLDQSTLELVSTSFIAGFTIVFGIVALAIVHAVVQPEFGEIARIAGALAFGVGLVFLVVGRAELFNENFFDPVATVIDDDSRTLSQLARLWVVTFALNIVGGAAFALVFSIEGTLRPATIEALRMFAEEFVGRPASAEFAKAIVGGALVSLMSFLLAAVDTVGGRVTIAYVVGVLLTFGPFDHVVVTVLHLFFGVLFGADFGVGALATTTIVVTAGNFVGGIGLVTLTHVAQAMGARESGD